MVSTPWAILLCKFNDNNSEPHPRKFYEDLFTKSGTGTENICMVDFFRDMSHGMLDLSGTQIFPTKEIGWYTVDESFKNYRPRADAGEPLRWALVNWAKEAATRYHPDWPKVDLSKFYGVVAVYNIGDVDLFGGMGRYDPGYEHGYGYVVCDEKSVKPSALGQEMGHGYGLDHSRSELFIPSKTDKDPDYHDPWDIMSTQAAFSASQSVYDSIWNPDINDFKHSIGPGLNAANMDGRGWLDNSRVWNPSYGVPTVVDLRPLHRRDLLGFLAITIDKYYVEFRMNEHWDAGFHTPVVLIHYLGEDNHSYLMGSILKNKDDKFEIKEGGREGAPLYYHLKIQLQDIDVTQRIARISIDYSPLSIRPDDLFIWPWEYRSPAMPLTHLRPAKDIVIVNEKIIRAPQWSLRPILKSLADISSSEQFKSEDIRKTIRREALKTIIKIADEELDAMDFPGGVAPSKDLGGQSQQST